MKKKLLTILLLCIMSTSLIACTAEQKKIDQALNEGATINMIPTDISIRAGDHINLAYYDPDTKIVYIQGTGITPYLGQDKQPMKIDEFLKLHGK